MAIFVKEICIPSAEFGGSVKRKGVWLSCSALFQNKRTEEMVGGWIVDVSNVLTIFSFQNRFSLCAPTALPLLTPSFTWPYTHIIERSQVATSIPLSSTPSRDLESRDREMYQRHSTLPRNIELSQSQISRSGEASPERGCWSTMCERLGRRGKFLTGCTRYLDSFNLLLLRTRILLASLSVKRSTW